MTSDTSPQAVGTVELCIHRVRQLRNRKQKFEHVKTATAPVVLHERNKKVGGHATQYVLTSFLPCILTHPFYGIYSLGPPQEMATRGSCRTKPYTPADVQPYVSFIFRYRPTGEHSSLLSLVRHSLWSTAPGILQAAGIIPRPPASVPDPTDDIPEDDEDEAARDAEIQEIEVHTILRPNGPFELYS